MRRPRGAPLARERKEIGAVAQLGEHLLCKQGVSGSIPLSSTIPDVLKETSLGGRRNILREK